MPRAFKQSQSALANRQPSAWRTRRQQRVVLCNADPAMMQDVLVGGAVTAAVGSAMFNGLKSGDVQLCDLCQGVGACPLLLHRRAS